MIVSPIDSFPDCLVDAVEREFPGVAVEQVTDLGDACVAFDQEVSLILVDEAHFSRIDEFSAELNRRHPGALVSLMMSGSGQLLSAENVFACKAVRGVLPMNLKLDVWLSIVRLMLRGGEYFPSEMFSSLVRQTPARLTSKPVPSSNGETGSQRPPHNSKLTQRETQILEMVSRGLQNKVIAANLQLSEHTVKIHVHNIIAKLGAHNRTEAASIFRGELE